MDDDTTKDFPCPIKLRKVTQVGEITIDQSKCKLNYDQVISLVRTYKTRMWQFRECGGLYWHMAEAIKDYGTLKTNGIDFPPVHRRKVRKES